MTNWNGTILGPPHVSLAKINATWSKEGTGKKYERLTNMCACVLECSREPNLLCQDQVRDRLP